MRKLLFTMGLLVMASVSAIAQSFTLTPNGFVSSDDETKNYVVVDIQGTQQELYKKVRAYLVSIYRSPKDVLSESEPDVITINGIESDAVQKKALGMAAASYDMNYTISIRFKDGRIRFDAPTFTLADYKSGSKTIRLLLQGKSNGGFGSEVINVIYNKKGELKAKYAKEALEKFFNNYITDLKKGVENNVGDDW